jgi:hypothetical protein
MQYKSMECYGQSMRASQTTSLEPAILAMSSGRVGPTVVALIGLISAVLGGLSIARPTGRGRIKPGQGAPVRLRGATLAAALGLFAIVLGTVFAVTADGGLGTGSGLGGAIVSVALGIAGVVLGGIAKARGPKH